MTADDELSTCAGAGLRRMRSGSYLDHLSIHQIEERIAALEAELVRLQEARKAKQASLGAAAAFFKICDFGI